MTPPDPASGNLEWTAWPPRPADLHVYADAGLGDEEANLWWSAGIAPYQAVGYRARGISLTRAVALWRVGVTGTEAARLRDGEVVERLRLGQPVVDELARRVPDVLVRLNRSDVRKVVTAVTEGRDLEAVVDLLRGGIVAADVAPWLDTGLTPAIVLELVRDDVPPPRAGALQEYVAAGFAAEDGARWSAADADVATAREFEDCGFVPAAARDWIAIGVDAATARAYVDARVTSRKARAYIDRGLTVEQAIAEARAERRACERERLDGFRPRFARDDAEAGQARADAWAVRDALREMLDLQFACTASSRPRGKVWSGGADGSPGDRELLPFLADLAERLAARGDTDLPHEQRGSSRDDWDPDQLLAYLGAVREELLVCGNPASMVSSEWGIERIEVGAHALLVYSDDDSGSLICFAWMPARSDALLRQCFSRLYSSLEVPLPPFAELARGRDDLVLDAMVGRFAAGGGDWPRVAAYLKEAWPSWGELSERCTRAGEEDVLRSLEFLANVWPPSAGRIERSSAKTRRALLGLLWAASQMAPRDANPSGPAAVDERVIEELCRVAPDWLEADDGRLWTSFVLPHASAETGEETLWLYLEVATDDEYGGDSRETEPEPDTVPCTWTVGVSEEDAGFGEATRDSGSSDSLDDAKLDCWRSAVVGLLADYDAETVRRIIGAPQPPP